MSDNEESLLKKFDELVNQCKKNVEGDCPSKDDILIIFCHAYIKGLKKLIAEKDHKLDIVMSRGATWQERENIAKAQVEKEMRDES